LILIISLIENKKGGRDFSSAGESFAFAKN